jgi:hypothetical protein
VITYILIGGAAIFKAYFHADTSEPRPDWAKRQTQAFIRMREPYTNTLPTDIPTAYAGLYTLLHSFTYQVQEAAGSKLATKA